MASLVSLSVPSFTYLTDSTPKSYELHQLCVWGADTACDGACSCAVMIRITSAGSAAAYVLEPGATVDEFDAAQALIAELPNAYLILSSTVFRAAAMQC